MSNVSLVLNNVSVTSHNVTPEYDALMAAARGVNRALWLTFALGFPANLASLATLLHMRKASTATILVAWLALVDDLCLLQKLIHHLLSFYRVEQGPTGCKLSSFVGFSMVTYANWLLSLIATERFVAVWFPLQKSFYMTVKKVVTAALVVAVVIALVFLQMFWTITSNGHECGVSHEYAVFVQRYWYWINCALYAFLPTIILAVLTALIVLGLWRSGKRRREMIAEGGGSRAAQEAVRAERNITVMLVVTTLTFVLLTFPNCVYVIMQVDWDVAPHSVEYARKILVHQVTFFLCDLNHAVNFYLYFLSCKRFRMHFLAMLRCKPATSKAATGRPSSTVQLTSLETHESHLSHCGHSPLPLNRHRNNCHSPLTLSSNCHDGTSPISLRPPLS